MSFYEFLFLFAFVVGVSTYLTIKLEERADRKYVQRNPHRFSKMDLERFNY